MKLVWKCEHCSHTEVDEQKMKEHELSCVFSLANKHCYTCDNKYNYYDSELCKVHYNGWPSKTDNAHLYYEAMEGKVKCKEWTNSESRTKKLLKLKDVIEKSKTI